MTRAGLRFEATRMLRRRSTYAIGVGGIAAALLSLYGNAHARLAGLHAGAPTVDASRFLVGLAFLLTLFSAVLGAISITRDFRHRSIGTLFVFSPSRRSVLAAKAGAAAAAGLVLGVVGTASCWLLTAVLMAHRGLTVDLGAHAIGFLAANVAVITVSGALGVLVGAIVRSQLFAVLGLVVWTAMIEAGLIHYFPSFGRWLPGGAEGGIVSDPSLAHALAPPLAWVVWAGWLSVALVCAIRQNAADVA